jgi:hypothetical protein
MEVANMPYNCASWDWEDDGFVAGPRPAPTMDGQACGRGEAGHYEIHPALMHWRRVALMTLLCTRGTLSTHHIAGELDWDLGHLPIVLRGMKHGGLVVSWPACRLHARPNWRGHDGRVWEATETGRWALWRYAWVARSTFTAYEPDLPLRDDMPDDPVDAVRAGVQQEFLRPASIAVARYLLERGPTSMRQASLAMRMPLGAVSQRVRAWDRKGWLQMERDRMTEPFQGERYPTWSFSDRGRLALDIHVDALRRAGRVCGWTPTPGCVTYSDVGPHCRIQYEEEFLRREWQL